jgi:hypothetical protein
MSDRLLQLHVQGAHTGLLLAQAFYNKISAQMLGTARLSKRRKERKDQSPGITVVWTEGPLQVKDTSNFSSADGIKTSRYVNEISPMVYL